MSTTYVPFLGIGKTFTLFDQVEQFLLKNDLINYLEPQEDIEELSERCGLLIHYLEDDDSYFVGVKVDSTTAMELANDVYDAERKFRSMVGVQGKLVHTVDSY